MTFPCRHHFQDDNKQAYSHAFKLPDARFRQIRFSGVSQLSGSVPRRGNKQSGVFRCAPAGCPEEGGTQHMVCHPGEKAAVTTGYGLRGTQRAGGGRGDPELTFFGSQEE